MEAFKEMHRHKRNKEHRQEQIACFKKVWTTDNIFGRSERDDIKWHLTPPQEFLPQELGAWMIPPIHIRRQSPSPGLEADFVVQHNFLDIVHDFLTEYSNNLPATQHATQPDNEHPNTTDPPQSQQVEPQATERPESFRNNLEGREEGRDRPTARTIRTPVATLRMLGKKNANGPSGSRPTASSNNHTGPRMAKTQKINRLQDRGDSHNRTVGFRTTVTNTDTRTLKKHKTTHLNVVSRYLSHRFTKRLCESQDALKLKPGVTSDPNPHLKQGETSKAVQERGIENCDPHDEGGIDELLKEIDRIRREDPLTTALPLQPLPLNFDNGKEKELAQPETGHKLIVSPRRPAKRHKVKCQFGPYKRQDTQKGEGTSSERDAAPPLGTSSLSATSTLQRSLAEAASSTQTVAADTFSRYDLRNLSPDNPFLITDHLGRTRIGPDRVTFWNPSLPQGGTPFIRYYATVPERPRPNPNRFAMARLGISEEELAARVASEIDEELRVIDAERRLARITDVDFPRLLSKEDCLVLFEATGVPTSGSLLGVYNWAADIDTSIPMSEIDAILSPTHAPATQCRPQSPSSRPED